MLSPIELAQAFPEMVPRAKLRIKELKQLNRHWEDCYSAIMWNSNLSDIDPLLPYRYEDLKNPNQYPVKSIWVYSKWFWIQAIRIYMRHDPLVQEQDTLTEYIKLVENKKEIKQKLDLSQIKKIPIDSMYAFKSIKRYGNVLCPFHNEKTPSFHIYRKSNTFHCFGCGANGDSISFYMMLHNVNFTTAVKALGGEDVNS